MRYLLIMGFVLGLIVILFEPVYATPFTPSEWQRKVEKHCDDDFVGQHKHTTWVRDKNQNFIDDVIDKRLEKVEIFNVIVDLNTYMTPNDIQKRFDGYGHIKYICKMITFILLNNVKASNLTEISKMDEVAMIEIQQNFEPALDISARAVQAKKCDNCLYSQSTAEDAGFNGSGINIAIIDTGVNDDHEQLEGTFKAGFDATIFEDDADHNGVDDSNDEPGNGETNPDDDWEKSDSKGHGTHVAGIALGKGKPDRNCRQQYGIDEQGNCAGVAREAGLVDIKVCHMKKCEAYNGCKTPICENQDMVEALDWLGLNFDKHNVRVANISLVYADRDENGTLIWNDEDGTHSIAQQVNYLSSLGIVMVAGHGNAGNFPSGTQMTHSPGSASFAITVSGTSDDPGMSDDPLWTIQRSDDAPFMSYLIGPRDDFPATSDKLALKPDISAPAWDIYSAKHDRPDGYRSHTGTSMAAPHVSGAAAIILGAYSETNPGGSEMNPGSVKDALIQSADNNQNNQDRAYPDFENSVYPNWDRALGHGMLNVRAAIDLVAARDVGFPTCSGPPNNPGRPCALSGGLPRWNNNEDISTSAPPQEGVEIDIIAKVKNSGLNDATVLVNFGVYIFAVGNNQFFHIGTKEVVIPGNSEIEVPHPWKPESADHQCVQVSIDYGLDTNFDNNVTQRNLQVAPSNFTLRVENPFSVPAEFVVRPTSQRKGWDCRVDEPKFILHPYLDPPKIVQIAFPAPKDAKPGERADCDVAVFAGPIGGKLNEIGGVTVQTFVPKPCRIIGWILHKGNRPISGAKVILNTRGQTIEAESDEYGFVSFEGTPYRPQKITVISKEYGEQSTKEPVRLYCGAGTFEILVTEKGLIIENNRRQKDWAWDSQVREGYEYKRRNKL